MRFPSSVGLALSTCLLLVATASAETIIKVGFDSVLGTISSTYPPGDGSATIDSAVLFRTQPGLAITSVTVDVQSYSFPGYFSSPDFDMWLYSTVPGPPGTDWPLGIAAGNPVAEIGQNIVAPISAALVTVTAPSGVVTPQDTYLGSDYIVLTPANPYTTVAWAGVLTVDEAPLASAPEPATITLFALALIGLPLLRKRR